MKLNIKRNGWTKNDWINFVFLATIIITAFFLRVYLLKESPPSLNWDEVSHGYNAYSILKTGKDEWGISFPLIFRAYGDFKLPLYIYLTTLPVYFFGLNEFSVRLISILSGVGLVFLTYLIARKVSKSKLTSLFAAFFTVVSPWSLFVSRVALEANLGAFLFSLGGYFLIDWIEKQKTKSLTFCLLFLGLSLHAYNSCRVVVPIMLLLIIFIACKKKLFKQILLPGILFLFFFTPILFQLFDKSGSARFGWVSLIDQGVINQIIDRRVSSKLPVFLAKAIFNKPVFFVYYSAKNYLANFSPNYLFFRGGSHYQFSQPAHELLYLVTAPFLLIGIFKFFLDKDKKGKLIIFWFLISFIPSAITKDAPHVLRSLLVLPTPMILSAIGLLWTTRYFERKKSVFGGKFIALAIIISVLVCFGKWYRDYFNIYPKAYSWAWQYGYKESVDFIKENYNKYDQIVITKRYGEPHEFFLFYLKYDPKKYQNAQDKKWDYHANWYWIDGFDKYIFVNDWELTDKVEELKSRRVENNRLLLITSPGNYPEAMPAGRQGWSKIKTINFLDGKPAFDILEN